MCKNAHYKLWMKSFVMTHIQGITLAEHVLTHYKKLAKQNKKKIWYFGILYTLVELTDFKFQRNLVCSS